MWKLLSKDTLRTIAQMALGALYSLVLIIPIGLLFFAIIEKQLRLEQEINQLKGERNHVEAVE